MLQLQPPTHSAGQTPRRLRRGLVHVAIAALACLATGGAHQARGAEGDAIATTAAVCADDVWLVSTRHLPGICRLPTAAKVAVERRTECGRWQRADVVDLLADADRPLVVFIHGNRYTVGDARQQGVQLARQLAGCCPTAGPVRTVIFSWPSEQQGLLLKDGRAKYERAHADAHYLAWLLGQIEPTRPVAIVGYSFGALITLGALDDLVAAERSGRRDVQPWIDRPGRAHFVFIAPAVRCDALTPRGPYREAVDCLDRLTLVINSRDDALKFFPFLDRDLRADALGRVSMPRRWLPPDVDFTATDAAAIVGKNHGLPLYLASPTLTATIAAGALEGL
ncbi:MAG: alpha/beta fold hydrolase [Pirellulales bacterium]